MSTDSSPVVDDSFLKEFAEAAGADSLPDFLTSFGEEARQGIAAVQAAVTAEDRTATTRTAHKLRSCAGSLGAVALNQLAATLEHQAREQPWPELRVLAGRLDEVYARTTAELAATVARLRGSSAPG